LKPLNYNEVKEAVSNGDTLESIAERFDCHKSDVSRFCKKFNIKTQKTGRRKGVTDKDIQANADTFLNEFYKIIQGKII